MNQSSSNKQALPEACFDSSDRILSLLDMEESDEAISEELSDHPYVIKEKGIINIGGKSRSVYSFAKQYNNKVKKILTTKEVQLPLNQTMNLFKMKRLVNKKNKI